MHTLAKSGPAGLYLMAAIVVFSVTWRLLPHELNMTPMFAMAMFAGVLIRHSLVRYLLPVAVFLLTDMLIGFHDTMLFVYAGLLSATFIGSLLSRRGEKGKGAKPVFFVGASLLNSLVFFLISNFGVWWVSGMYSLTPAGLLECYVMAIPFLWKAVAGDLFFVLSFYTLMHFSMYSSLSGKRYVA